MGANSRRRARTRASSGRLLRYRTDVRSASSARHARPSLTSYVTRRTASRLEAPSAAAHTQATGPSFIFAIRRPPPHGSCAVAPLFHRGWRFTIDRQQSISHPRKCQARDARTHSTVLLLHLRMQKAKAASAYAKMNEHDGDLDKWYSSSGAWHSSSGTGWCTCDCYWLRTTSNFRK
jgi:hypothetical protein